MPHDLKNKSFQKVLRGYAPDEVDEYIAYMSEEYRKLERRAVDSDRKLSLALKKLEEAAKNGTADTVGPAAREAAAKLLRETEEKSSAIIADAERRANENAEAILEEARTRAKLTVDEAVAESEAILAAAREEAEAHRDDVKHARDTAHAVYNEIDSFREKLYELYNEHLDALEAVTDAARVFIDGVDEKAPVCDEVETVAVEDDETETEPVEPVEAVEPVESAEAVVAFENAEDVPDADVDVAIDLDVDESAEEAETIEVASADTDVDENEFEETENEGERHIGDEVASNLAFMDRLFANMQDSGDESGEDLYVDIPEEGEEELPPIMIDWKNRSAVSSDEVEAEPEEVTDDHADDEVSNDYTDDDYEDDEMSDFRYADGFEDFETDDVGDAEGGESVEENYDEYSPDDSVYEELSDEETDEVGGDEDGELDEYHDMDQIFNEDKSKRDMSLTDEFNIIFADSKSNQNVKEISRQPIVAPEAPKNAKKHKKF